MLIKTDLTLKLSIAKISLKVSGNKYLLNEITIILPTIKGPIPIKKSPIL